VLTKARLTSVRFERNNGIHRMLTVRSEHVLAHRRQQALNQVIRNLTMRRSGLVRLFESTMLPLLAHPPKYLNRFGIRRNRPP